MGKEKLAANNIRQPLHPGWWLSPKPFDVVSSALYLGVLSTYLYTIWHPCGCLFVWWKAVLFLGSLVTLLGIDRFEFRLFGEETPMKTALLLLLLRIILIEELAWIDEFFLSPFLYLIPPFLGCWYFGKSAGYVLAGLAWIRYLLREGDMFQWFRDPSKFQYVGIFTIGLIFIVTMAHVVVTEKTSRKRTEELLSELETSHQQLQAYSEQVEELATTRERNRLARDIHDTLGHYLTVINVQLEKALAFRGKKPDIADQAVSDAKRLASEALQDVRRSVGALRSTQEIFSFLPALHELIERVRSDQCPVELRIKGSEKQLSKQGLLTLYRAVQEGLTNVQKHAQASAIQVDICFDEQGGTLVLRDDGRGFDPIVLQNVQQGRHTGYGLQGIQERLGIIGGNVQIASEPGQGSELIITLPHDKVVQGG